jgi:hypothetical protein
MGRLDISLNTDWETSMDGHTWRRVDVPHNWDTYGGYRRLKHGNLHGTAWYRKHFSIKEKGERYFLFFEGVGSYATVRVNGLQVGTHAGGRTSFTLDITDAIRPGSDNLITMRADHPAGIRDLPWVCGACSDERGFSEGSQPLGIFRPVHLVITHDTRIEPFGVHVWNDSTARLSLETEIKNYGSRQSDGTLTQRLIDRQGHTVAVTQSSITIPPGKPTLIRQEFPAFSQPHLWSITDPYLYTLITEFSGANGLIDEVKTPYGIRTIRWTGSTFLLNGKPVFINGVCEYEHKLGGSHAFSEEEIRARVMEIKAAGFNAFRDAHQPHNLLYQHYWDSLGFLWWPQLSAHIWNNSPEFRENFKTLLTEWVKERRNSPSLILWGLQNESKLPADFAAECTRLIRQLDPTASSQRKVTTCNGGAGTDWDVPQNWTGTYGGDPARYAEDLRKEVLVGEYGGWRTLDLHGDTTFSEDRLCRLMEAKIGLAESVKDSVAGHFFWLFSSHDNPGRVQSGEGRRELDRIGPVNYKGLLSPWGEPLDVYYLYRANFTPKETDPMVYIVSHTWPDRWTSPGINRGIVVYSNCDEVELFNDVDGRSLGKKMNPGRGMHFQWDSVDIRYNVLYAIGYVGGRPVARDCMILHHLPKSPHYDSLIQDEGLLQPQPDYNYLYRVNCGGPDYTDHLGHLWKADVGSHSWTNDYPGLPAYFASQRRSFDPIGGTADWPLFQDFRFGLNKLGYTFPVQDGDYMVELYFVEPWYGRGGGMDCSGWRMFDITMNDRTVARNVDIWKEAGYSRALKKTFRVKVTGGQLVIGFPKVEAGQVVISAIAIATRDKKAKGQQMSKSLIRQLHVKDPKERNRWSIQSWMDTGVPQYSDGSVCFSSMPPELYGAEWVRGPKGVRAGAASFRLSETADVFVMDSLGVHKQRWPAGSEIMLDGRTVAVCPVNDLETAYDQKPVTAYKTANARVAGDTLEWNIFTGVADKYSLTVKYRWLGAMPVTGKLVTILENGTLIREETVTFSTTRAGKWNYLETSTGTMINAGHYHVQLIIKAGSTLKIDELQVQ